MSNAQKIRDFCTKYGVANDEVWQVKGGKSYAILHSAIERIAFQHNVTFTQPTVIEANSKDKIAVVLVTGKLGDFEQWSIGEAAPTNNKNDYPWAMAEKRAKDRVVLKLLNIHGILYSEDELGGNVNGSAMPPPAPAAALEPDASEERTESEVEAFGKLKKLLESTPTVKALDALMKSTEWTSTIAVANENDKPTLRKAYAERRETLTYKEAN